MGKMFQFEKAYLLEANVERYRAVIRGTAAGAIKLPTAKGCDGFVGATLEKRNSTQQCGLALGPEIALLTAGEPIGYGVRVTIFDVAGKIGVADATDWAIGETEEAATADGHVIAVKLYAAPYKLPA